MLDAFFKVIVPASLLVSVFLFVIERNYRSHHLDKYLRFWLLLLMLQLVFYYLHLEQLISQDSLINLLGYPLSLLHMPLLYLGIVHLNKTRSIRRYEVLLHAQPYVIYVLSLMHWGVDFQQALPNFGDFVPKVVRRWSGMPFAVSGFLYALGIAVNLRKKITLEERRFLEQIQLRWLKYLMWSGVILFIVVFVIISGGTDFSWYAMDYIFKFVALILSLFLVSFSYNYHRQIAEVFRNSQVRITISDSSSIKTDRRIQDLADDIPDHLERSQCYLDAQLSLTELAKQLDTSPQLLSEAINRKLSTSFYDLINGRRLHHAQKMLIDEAYDHYSILGIGFASGFPSKSTFYKYFKVMTDMTPSQFRKKYRQ